jgi:class 3 adenylate cyclase/CHASE2 domain-containing sensor protein
METDCHTQRKLAAIMFTDMVGFSALAQRNETLALELLEAYRVVLRSELARYGGQEIKTIGDGFLLKFDSVLEGAHYAIEVQKQLVQRNQKELSSRQVHVRIGLHVGDVILQEQDVLGDDVNIAARLEPLAPPDGICLSEAAARQVQNKLEYPLVSLGPMALKNIQNPIEIFRIALTDHESTASKSQSIIGALFARLKTNRPTAAAGTIAALAIGALLHFTRLGEGTANLSYDLLNVRPQGGPPHGVVVIEMDELSYRILNQDYDKIWDRSIHSRLLNKLQRDGAKLVVMDVFLSDSGTHLLTGAALADALDKNQRLADAIRNNPNVVLAADLVSSGRSDVVGDSVVLPFHEFVEAASNRWGLARTEIDSDMTVRRHYIGTETDPSLSWCAAQVAGAQVTREPELRLQQRWLRYYGPPPAFPRLSYQQALEQPPDYFREKLVFIGGRPRVLKVGQQSDVFRTPYMRWHADFTPGVEIVATATLNLLHKDWYQRIPSTTEFALVMLCGLLFGCGFALVSPLASAGLAALGTLFIALAALSIAWTQAVWFNWTGLALGQIPATLIWVMLWKNQLLIQRWSNQSKRSARPAPITQKS